ncbi:MAG TPA: hypothetical protein PL029_04745 [Bacteroidia bacterium]|nr:hypothetical protein [Bacteroidia bacterium]
MSHFKYEINERNLRMQLKDNSVPLNDEAWNKFESFSATQKNYAHENVMKRFNISLNRNIVLPVVFGGVIVLFSLLLFNFVNIKNPNQETAEINTETIVAAPATEEKKPEIQAPVKKQTMPAPVTDSVNSVVQDEIKTEQPETTNVLAEAEKPVIRIQKKTDLPDTGTAKADTKAELPAPEMIINAGSADRVNPAAGTETPKKKKKQKRQLIVTEPTVEEDEQAPPPVSQTTLTEEIQ